MQVVILERFVTGAKLAVHLAQVRQVDHVDGSNAAQRGPPDRSNCQWISPGKQGFSTEPATAFDSAFLSPDAQAESVEVDIFSFFLLAWATPVETDAKECP